jgi:probable rRNA maturation factor
MTDGFTENESGEPPSCEVTILIHDTRWLDAISTIETLATHTIHNVLEDENTAGDVAVVLSNDVEIHSMNRDFRGKDAPTNVLSFSDGEEGALGDIILSLDTLQREASEQHKKLEHHVTHMLVHGTLHLLGHDHEHDDEAELMEAREIAFLNRFNISNPYSEV